MAARRRLHADNYTLGFDGSKGRKRGVADATAVAGVRVEDAFLHPLALWEATPGDDTWKPPRAEIEATVEAHLADRRCVGVRFDPAGGWGQKINEWESHYRPVMWSPLPFEITGPWAVRAFERLYDDIDAGAVTYDPHAFPDLDRHLLAARRLDKTIGKEHTGPTAAKIDLAAAAAYAWIAYLDALKHRPRSTGKVVGI